MVAAVGLALAVCGCASTQTTAARLRLNDDRIRASQQPSRVQPGDVSSSVAVSSETFLTAGHAFTVVVKNGAARAVSALPISVGYRLGAKTVYLNATVQNYFDSHLPAVAAHGTLTWVDAGTATIPARAKTFVRVGATPTVSNGTFTPPVITINLSTAPSAESRVLSADLTNRSSIPQYQLPIYAVITRAGHVVGGSSRSIADLAGGAKTVVRLALPAGATSQGLGIQVEAPATIFK